MIEKTAQFIEKTLFFFLPEGHPWDYFIHVILSFVGVSLIFLLLRLLNVNQKLSLGIALFVMLAIGVIKEINDLQLGKTDVLGDMLANLIGIGAATAIALFILKSPS